MSDRFETHASGRDAPASHRLAVTPHDSNELSETTRALYVGRPVNLSLILASGAHLLLTGVPAGHRSAAGQASPRQCDNGHVHRGPGLMLAAGMGL